MAVDLFDSSYLLMFCLQTDGSENQLEVELRRFCRTTGAIAIVRSDFLDVFVPVL